MATYKTTGELASLIERPLYGSSRVGMDVRPVFTRNVTQSDTGVFTRYLTQKQYELSDHLGNVRAVVTDVKYATNNVFAPDVVSYQNYYPFGMLQEERIGSTTSYRYGYNGKEKDDEVKGAGNSLDFGARIYDTRIGKFLSVDPEQKKFAYNSPYIFAANTPISAIDKDGGYPLFLHYAMTYFALADAGIDLKTARELAHLASTYADNPNPEVKDFSSFLLYIGIPSFNALGMITRGLDPGNLARNESIYGSYNDTKFSQDDDKIESVSIHAMRAYFEDITASEAVNRAVHGGTFEVKDPITGKMKSVTIEGAENVINRFVGRNLSELTMDEKKVLAVALHTIQDAQVHQGGFWVDKHKEESFLLQNPNQHPNAGCTLGENSEAAKTETIKAIRAIQTGTQYKFELHNDHTSQHSD